MTNYNDGNWHVWAKHEKPPLHDLTRIKRVYINVHGDLREDVKQDFSVHSCSWSGDGVVLAFRVVKEHREPLSGQMIWNSGRSCFEMCLHPDAGYRHGDTIHVREVIEE